MSYSESYNTMLRIENDAYKYEITEESPRIDPSNPHLKIPLRAHQAAAVHRMIEQEIKLSDGWDLSGYKLYSKWSVLGDGVGVGKSLTVLSHIAHLKTKTALSKMPLLTLPANPYMFSTQTPPIYDISHCNASLIVVPHTLFRQWCDYIKTQSTLTVFKIQSKKNLAEKFYKNLFSSDAILISNTLYPSFIGMTEKIHFNRVYFDEADSLRISGTNPLPNADFYWLISASWMNLLFHHCTLYISMGTLQLSLQNTSYHKDFIEKYRPLVQQANTYYYPRYYTASPPFFNCFISNRHPLRGRLVVRSAIDFIKTSIQLPHLFRHTILCRAPFSYNVIRNAITPEISAFLHAGDVQSALQALGVQTEGKTNLIEAVTENRKKELERLQKTYDFKASLEYSTPVAKEAALLALTQKINHLLEQIKNIHERISNCEKEACPICFDDPQEAVITKCCQRIFCASCILTSLTRSHTCPLCRAPTFPRDLKKIGLESTAPARQLDDIEPSLLLKKDALLKLLVDNPQGKFLVFSRYDNPFTQIQEDLLRLRIGVKEVKGNKDVIQSTLTAFKDGAIRCLLLNSLHAGSGLTITAATHVVILHSMLLEEEKQILGRAYRLGRTEPLHVFKLLHEDEVQSTN